MLKNDDKISCLSEGHFVKVMTYELLDQETKDTYNLEELFSKFNVHIKTMDGRVITLDVTGDEYVQSVKSKSEEQLEDFPAFAMKLIYDGQELDDNCTLAHYLVDRDSTLFAKRYQR